MKKVLIFSLMSLVLASCNETIKGDGVIVNESREMNQFNVLSTSGIFTIELREGEPRVEIRTDQNLMEHIVTEVKGGELVISSNNKHLDSEVMEIVVYYVNLEEIEIAGAVEIYSPETIDGKSLEIEISGAGEAELDLRLEKFEVNVSGGAEMSLSGYANEANYDLTGAAEIRAFNLQTSVANIDIAGASDLEVNVSDKLNVDIAGAGEVKYIGDPVVNKDITGAGELVKVK